ncbi:MAG TPA: alcohol dehydrogenase catalytic domain-containing protein, partial [Candidatus Dormibacteraeota bacterium]|nr:alcohol dehydrogenase catalytic domain-containing protein [Candidatus Dormibacteraeota bacterium]
EVRLRVLRAAICGTDVSEYLHGPLLVPLTTRHPGSGHLGPVVLGHEVLGRVLEVGEGAETLAPGQRVALGAGVWCGRCAWCREGRPNLCQRYYTIGLHAHGGLAELVTVPAAMCRVVPDRLADDHAVLAQPAAIALHALRRAGAAPGRSLALIGVGGIGAFILAAAAARGVDPLIACDVSPSRLATAAALAPRAHLLPAGAGVAEAVRDLTGGAGADLVVEASGSAAGLAAAPGLVRRGGRLLLVGLQAEPRPLDLHDLVIREVDVITSNAHVCDLDLPEALELLASTGIGPHVVDRVIALEDLVPEGVMALAGGGVRGKVVVRP